MLTARSTLANLMLLGLSACSSAMHDPLRSFDASAQCLPPFRWRAFSRSRSPAARPGRTAERRRCAAAARSSGPQGAPVRGTWRIAAGGGTSETDRHHAATARARRSEERPCGEAMLPGGRFVQRLPMWIVQSRVLFSCDRGASRPSSLHASQNPAPACGSARRHVDSGPCRPHARRLLDDGHHRERHCGPRSGPGRLLPPRRGDE